MVAKAGSGATPRPVTRGESFNGGVGIDGVETGVDWLHASFKAADPETVVSTLRALVFSDGEFRYERKEGKGLFGFAESEDVLFRVAGEWQRIAVFAWGGSGPQAEMGFLQITGMGCNALRLNDDMDARRTLRAALSQVDAKLTRLDICFDTEALDIMDCWAAYQSGEFGSGGRKPSYDQCGDWLEHQGRGRTLYIGRATNGKLIRCYEKGKQLGDKLSKWLRLEAQWGSRDRVIPLDAITDSDAYFSGACTFFGGVLSTVPRLVKTVQKAAVIVCEKLLTHASDAYGRLVNQLSRANFSSDDIVRMLRREGAPRRMVPFVLDGKFYPGGFFQGEVRNV